MNSAIREKKVYFVVPGEPQGKLRARWGPRGMYTPQKTINYEVYIKELFVIKYPDFQPLSGALGLELTAWVSVPKSTSMRKMELMLSDLILPTKKPDFDNIIKTAADALEKLAYKNDNQIVTCTIKKFYSETPRLEIIIYGENL